MIRIENRPVESSVPEPPSFSLAGLIGDLGRHTELDPDTLAYHLTQSDATAAGGCWHAAVNEARSFLEGLLVGIVRVVRPDSPNKSDGNGSVFRTPFRSYRQALLQAGLIDADGDELLQYVYSVASAKGCHPGATSEVWCRLARRMVFITGQYVIQRYAGWKPIPLHPAATQAGQRDTPGVGNCEPANAGESPPACGRPCARSPPARDSDTASR